MKLEVNQVNKHYGPKHVLKDVSFSVSAGNTLGLLGRNGHGKSTTMKIIMGIIYSDSGTVTLDGTPINDTHFKLGYLPEERGLYAKSVILDQIVYFGKLRGLTGAQAKKNALELLERLEMTEYINKKASTLSKGNQQKIQLAISLINDPDIIILDEPYSGLDPVNSKMLQDVVEENAKRNKLILFSSHQLNTVEEFCKDICIINKGKVLISGNLETIKNQYPKNKLVISTQGAEDQTMLEQLVKGELNAYVTDHVISGATLEIRLKEANFKNRLLERALQESVNINAFDTPAPTLLEIFLEKVGQDEEA